MNKVYYAFKPSKIEEKENKILNAVVGCSILLIVFGLMGLAIGLVETYVK